MTLEGRDLAIGYRGRRVGEGLNLALPAGRALALLGPNGGGKTTLLKTLIGLIRPLAGEVRLDGRPLSELPPRERARRIAYVPQVHLGTFGFSVADVVMMGRTAHQGPFSEPSAHDVAVVRDALGRLSITHLEARPYTMISGGERQLALIARALAQEPRIVVLDEPTASLDFGNQGRVLTKMRALAASGLGILFTTHDPNQALRHADDVAMIRDGRLIAHDRADVVVTKSALRDLYSAGVEEIGSGETRAFLPV